MIKINLQRIAKKRGIENLYTFLVKAGVDSDTATYWNQGKANYVRLDKLERVCELLVCEVYDVLEWHPDKDADVATHPLRAMLPKHDEVEIKQILKQLPIDKLDELLKEAKRLKGE